MKWTTCQLKAKETLQDWINSPIVLQSDHFRCLEGPAGCGKSTVVEAIISSLPKSKILGAAPTHTAKDVLIEFSKLQAVTVHQLLGLKPDTNLEYYNPANPIYAPLKDDLFDNIRLVLIIIDECSMLNKAIVKRLKERALETGIKILFIGDRIQFPPIGETISDVFTTVEGVNMVEIVRQDDSNPVNEMISIARSDAQNKTNELSSYFNDIRNSHPTNITLNEAGEEQGYIMFKDGDSSDIRDKLYALYSSTIAQHDYKYVKIIAYTNQKVKLYNRQIKSIVNPSELPVSEGDWLLGYSPFKQGMKTLTQNGLYYKVLSATLFQHVYNTVTYLVIKVRLQYTITSDSGFKKVCETNLKILHPDSYEEFFEVLVPAWQEGTKARRWKKYYSLLENFMLMDDFEFDATDARGNPKRYNLAKKNIDLGYAITAHKSQGGSFSNVYVDYDNFSKCFDQDVRRSLSYVSLSRTKRINLIYG